MSYYPKSQIKTNLYSSSPDNKLTTQPLQQQLSNIVVFYIGPYYETSLGNKYTGKSPGDGNNLLLYPVTDYAIEDTQLFPEIFPNQIIIDPLYVEESYKNQLQPRLVPQYYTPFPTPQETQQGSIIRYFCKKGNEYRYIEINKETYNKLFSQDKTVAWDLYTPISLQWSTVSNTSYPPTSYFENQLGWVGFSRYVKPLKTPTTIQPK
jgi:hypothetical protein